MNGNNYNDPSLLDGFFIRDDVPIQFHTHFNDVDTVSSDALALLSKECRNKEMSRDNAIYLYLGLLCVQEFVDPSASYNGVPLRTFAIYEARRIFNAIKGDGDWVLRNLHNNEEPVFRGNGKGIEGIFFHNAFPFVRKTFNGGSGNFHNAKSSTYRYAWNQMQYPMILSPTGINRFMSEGMIACLGATGNSWSHCPLSSPFLQPFTCNGYGGINTTALAMNRYAARAKEAQYLIYDLVFGSNVLNPHVTPSTVKAMLNTAPCGGPYSVFPHHGVYGWCVPNRFWTQRKSKGGEDGRNENLVHGPNNSNGDEYNGLDYMLLHNLYWLSVDGQGFHDPEYHWEDVRHTRVDNAWPYFHPATAGIYNLNAFNAWLGSNQNPRVIRAIHTLRANTRLKSVHPATDTFWQNANVTYRAGEEIELTDGFEVDFGSNFEAYIEPMLCVGGQVQRTAGGMSEDEALIASIYRAADVEDSLAIAYLMDSLGFKTEAQLEEHWAHYLDSLQGVWEAHPDTTPYAEPLPVTELGITLLERLPADKILIAVALPYEGEYALCLANTEGEVLQRVPLTAKSPRHEAVEWQLSDLQAGNYTLILQHLDQKASTELKW